MTTRCFRSGTTRSVPRKHIDKTKLLLREPLASTSKRHKSQATSVPLVTKPPPNKRLKLTGHRALQISVLPSRHEIMRFQLPGHQGRQLSREPLGGTSAEAAQKGRGE
jgi:hypothetical protein